MADHADLFKTFEALSSCGENLEYSPEFLALQQAVAGRPEQQFGDTIIPAQTPDWALIERETLQLCERTCDIRIMVLLTQAWTELNGISGFADGVELLTAALERHWDNVYPLLHLDNEFDPMPRINALVAVGALQGVVRSLRSATLLTDVHGQVSVRVAEALLDGSRTQSEHYPGGRPRLIEALRHAHLTQVPELLAVSRSLASLQSVETIVTEKIGSEWVPDYTGVRRTLDLIANAMDAVIEARATGESASLTDREPESTDAGLRNSSNTDVGAEGPARMAWQTVAIQSRGDAVLALEQVCRYFESHEPSHPAPFLIRRAQQTIPLDFYEMLQNLAPQGVDQFEAWIPKTAAE